MLHGKVWRGKRIIFICIFNYYNKCGYEFFTIKLYQIMLNIAANKIIVIGTALKLIYLIL